MSLFVMTKTCPRIEVDEMTRLLRMCTEHSFGGIFPAPVGHIRHDHRNDFSEHGKALLRAQARPKVRSGVHDGMNKAKWEVRVVELEQA